MEDAFYTMGLVVSTMIDGVCCCDQVKEENVGTLRKEEQKEKAIENAFRTELGQHTKTHDYHNQHHQTTSRKRREDIVQAYTDAMSSRWENEHKFPHMAHQTSHYSHYSRCSSSGNSSSSSSNTLPYNRQYNELVHLHRADLVKAYKQALSSSPSRHHRDGPPVQLQHVPTAGNNVFPQGVPARERNQSFASMSTKRSDNLYSLNQEFPELFLFPSPSGRHYFGVSGNKYYWRRNNSPLGSIQPTGSHLEDDSIHPDNDDWLGDDLLGHDLVGHSLEFEEIRIE